jgi:hypothetical protein
LVVGGGIEVAIRCAAAPAGRFDSPDFDAIA